MSQGSLFWWWWRLTGRAQPFIPNALQLSDFVTAGRGVIEVLALLGAEVVGNDLYDGPNGEGTIDDPASDLALDQLDITITRVQRAGNRITINRAGADAWSTGFEGSGVYTAATVYVQTLDGLVVMPIADTLDDAGSGFLRLNVPAAGRPIINGIDTGERFIVAIARPAAAGDRLMWGTDRLMWGSDELRWAA